MTVGPISVRVAEQRKDENSSSVRLRLDTDSFEIGTLEVILVNSSDVDAFSPATRWQLTLEPTVDQGAPS